MRQYEAYPRVDSTCHRQEEGLHVTKGPGRQFGFKTGSIVGAG